MFAHTTIVATAALGAVLLLGRLVYLAFFHPLGKYPGPWIAKLTNAYAAYHGWKGDIHLDMWRCHRKYGDYVRYGPNRLLLNTAEGLRDIYGIGSLNRIIKSDAYTPLVHRAPNTLTIRGGKEHARRRRIMAQGVSEKAQRGYESRVSAHIAKFCSTVFPNQETEISGRVWSEAMDMSRWCYYLSFDIMSDVVFGAKYNLLQSERFRYVVESIDKSNVRMSLLIQFPQFAALKIDKYFFRDAITARNRFVKFVTRVVGERLTKGEKDVEKYAPEDADVFANLAAAKDPETGEGFTLDEIAAESTTLIVAGADTSSVTLAAILFYLADNKEAYNRAAAEVRSKFRSRNEIVMGAALASCEYLRACIDEAMRMSPPVGLALWREVAATGVVLDGHAIPKGVDVGVPLYSIHHDAKYYTNPFEYQPDRWLIDDGTGSIERARSAFNPFSIGMRGCLGKGLANTEMALATATILFLGDFKFAGGEKGQVGRGRLGAELGRHRNNEYQLFDHVTGQKDGPFLRFSSRRIV